MRKRGRRESVNAAKSRLTTAVETSRVNAGLQKILPGRAFGSKLGVKRSMFKQRPKQQLNARVLPADAAVTADVEGEGAPDAGATADAPSTSAAVPSAGGSMRAPLHVGGVAGPSSSKAKVPLTMEDLLWTLKRDPVYSRSAVHYRIRSDYTAACAAAPAE